MCVCVCVCVCVFDVMRKTLTDVLYLGVHCSPGSVYSSVDPTVFVSCVSG